MMSDPVPIFEEVSESKFELDQAIEGLQWFPMVQAIDKYAAVPVVRCP